VQHMVFTVLKIITLCKIIYIYIYTHIYTYPDIVRIQCFITFSDNMHIRNFT